jgi:hypothetical protein
LHKFAACFSLSMKFFCTSAVLLLMADGHCLFSNKDGKWSVSHTYNNVLLKVKFQTDLQKECIYFAGYLFQPLLRGEKNIQKLLDAECMIEVLIENYEVHNFMMHHCLKKHP